MLKTSRDNSQAVRIRTSNGLTPKPRLPNRVLPLDSKNRFQQFLSDIGTAKNFRLRPLPCCRRERDRHSVTFSVPPVVSLPSAVKQKDRLMAVSRIRSSLF